MEAHDELLAIAENCEKLAERFNDPQILEPVNRLTDAAVKVGKSWSKSWIGYQAYVYYRNFEPPPLGAQFSREWGLMDLHFIKDIRGDWQEYNEDIVKRAINEIASQPDINPARELQNQTEKLFEKYKSEIISILTTASSTWDDPYLESVKRETESSKIASPYQMIEAMKPTGTYWTRDSRAMTQGLCVPPHIDILGETLSIRNTEKECKDLAGLAKQAGSHLARKQKAQKKSDLIGTNVFIGHGQSLLWRELKDFIGDRLHLPFDEFNRVPVAGVTNIARLSEMLDAAAIAFLLLTGEDEQADGELHARLNVVHEAGLFQGRLGFTRAIILLEEGCKEFSNIQGLGQIRFPKGNISAAFEEIRRVLEREEIIDT